MLCWRRHECLSEPRSVAGRAAVEQNEMAVVATIEQNEMGCRAAIEPRG